MALNNRCPGLIVYGSHAPGGVNHAKVAHLPGTWCKGKILVEAIEPPDDIGPGACDVVEAWLILFPGAGEMPSYMPEGMARDHERSRVLFERWQALDDAMGAHRVRHQERWWPADAEPVVNDAMKVCNIYVPLARFPYLANPDDAVHPDDERDPVKLWTDVKTGRKRYDWSTFEFMLCDSHPSLFEGLSGDLPSGHEFIARLNRLLADHGLTNTDPAHAWQDDNDLSLPRGLAAHALTPQRRIEAARADIAQRAELLRAAGREPQAAALAQLRFVATPPDPDAECSLRDTAGDLLCAAQKGADHWLWCLREACRGLTRSHDMEGWLLKPWLELPPTVDLEPSYALWKAGATWLVVDGVCHVFDAP